jgi:hypothetical protein
MAVTPCQPESHVPDLSLEGGFHSVRERGEAGRARLQPKAGDPATLITIAAKCVAAAATTKPCQMAF